LILIYGRVPFAAALPVDDAPVVASDLISLGAVLVADGVIVVAETTSVDGVRNKDGGWVSIMLPVMTLLHAGLYSSPAPVHQHVSDHTPSLDG
jgi:hypothetical protein